MCIIKIFKYRFKRLSIQIVVIYLGSVILFMIYVDVFVVFGVSLVVCLFGILFWGVMYWILIRFLFYFIF